MTASVRPGNGNRQSDWLTEQNFYNDPFTGNNFINGCYKHNLNLGTWNEYGYAIFENLYKSYKFSSIRIITENIQNFGEDSEYCKFEIFGKNEQNLWISLDKFKVGKTARSLDYADITIENDLIYLTRNFENNKFYYSYLIKNIENTENFFKFPIIEIEWDYNTTTEILFNPTINNPQIDSNTKLLYGNNFENTLITQLEPIGSSIFNIGTSIKVTLKDGGITPSPLVFEQVAIGSEKKITLGPILLTREPNDSSSVLLEYEYVSEIYNWIIPSDQIKPATDIVNYIDLKWAANHGGGGDGYTEGNKVWSPTFTNSCWGNYTQTAVHGDFVCIIEVINSANYKGSEESRATVGMLTRSDGKSINVGAELDPNWTKCADPNPNETKITSFTLKGNILNVSYINSKFVQDWVGVYKVGQWPQSFNSIVWKSVQALGNGSLEIDLSAPTNQAGASFQDGEQYYLIFMKNGGYIEYPQEIDVDGEGQGNLERSRTNVFTYETPGADTLSYVYPRENFAVVANNEYYVATDMILYNVEKKYVKFKRTGTEITVNWSDNNADWTSYSNGWYTTFNRQADNSTKDGGIIFWVGTSDKYYDYDGSVSFRLLYLERDEPPVVTNASGGAILKYNSDGTHMDNTIHMLREDFAGLGALTVSATGTSDCAELTATLDGSTIAISPVRVDGSQAVTLTINADGMEDLRYTITQVEMREAVNLTWAADHSSVGDDGYTEGNKVWSPAFTNSAWGNYTQQVVYGDFVCIIEVTNSASYKGSDESRAHVGMLTRLDGAKINVGAELDPNWTKAADTQSYTSPPENFAVVANNEYYVEWDMILYNVQRSYVKFKRTGTEIKEFWSNNNVDWNEVYRSWWTTLNRQIDNSTKDGGIIFWVGTSDKYYDYDGSVSFRLLYLERE